MLKKWKKSCKYFGSLEKGCTFALAFGKKPSRTQVFRVLKEVRKSIFDRLQTNNKAVYKSIQANVIPCLGYSVLLGLYISGRRDKEYNLDSKRICLAETDNLIKCHWHGWNFFFQSFKDINLGWRVWSWLRMNASYRLNTCKSRGNMKEACFLWWRPANGWVTRIQPALCSGIALRNED